MGEPQSHFLVLTFPAQGHINPALHLANLLATSTSSRVTFSTPVSVHNSLTSSSTHHPLITFTPFSDGYDNGFNGYNKDYSHYMSQFALIGSKTVTNLITSLSFEDHPVTCIIYTIMLPWAADVARHLGIPSVLYWIQPATVFSVYYRYFHGDNGLIESHKDDPSFQLKLPNLPPLEIRDLPSFLLSPNDMIYSFIFKTIEQLIGILDREETKPTVIVNTFDALEGDALESIEEVEMIGIGPSVTASRGNLFEHGTKGYMEWLDSKPPSSVVYVSFGTLAVLQENQMEEILKGLELGGRDFLWVVNKIQREAGDVEIIQREVLLNKRGMLVNWCNQMEVLSHPSIGCFVTHCGWNSTLESLVSGVPTVGMPQWTDQATNAKLVKDVWGTGVRARVSEEGVVVAEEIVRCLDAVTGEVGVDVRGKAEEWKKKALEAMGEGGSSYRNMKRFVEDVAREINLHG